MNSKRSKLEVRLRPKPRQYRILVLSLTAIYIADAYFQSLNANALPAQAL